MKGGPSMLTCVIVALIAFAIGVWAKGLVEALDPAVDAKLQAEGHSILLWILLAFHWLWGKIFGLPKTPTTPAAPNASASNPAARPPTG